MSSTAQTMGQTGDLTIADVTAVIRYAQTVGPPSPPPDVPYMGHSVRRLIVRFNVDLHDVTDDVFDAMLSVHDNLPWVVQRWRRADGAHDDYRSASLNCGACTLDVYSRGLSRQERAA